MNTHRTGFRAGVDFTEDSRMIQWHDSCADEGAQPPVGYEDGMPKQHPSDWVLLLIAVALVFVAAFFPEWSMA